MTAEQIAAIAGAILSLAFSYIPGLREKYEPQSAEAIGCEVSAFGTVI
jgi:hypothetical protein